MSGVDLTSNGTIDGTYGPANVCVGQAGRTTVRTLNLSSQVPMLILELNPFREDLGPLEGRGGGAEQGCFSSVGISK